MTLKEIPVELKEISQNPTDKEVVETAIKLREEARELYAEEKYEEALEKVVEALRRMREFSDFGHKEFRVVLTTLLFDLSEIHFVLKDFKQSEKDLEFLFKVVEHLLKEDADRFGRYHILAMELSTRILRSRKKTLELLAKQQINTGVLYEKVNSGVAAATDKLVESLRKSAEMMAQTGDYRSAARFYMEAIKIAKKRTGRVTRREVKMTVELAKVMLHSRTELDRAKRLLNAILPHAVALENLELEQEILHLLEKIEADVAHEPMWRSFLEKVQRTAKTKFRRSKNEEENRDEDSAAAAQDDKEEKKEDK